MYVHNMIMQNNNAHPHPDIWSEHDHDITEIYESDIYIFFFKCLNSILITSGNDSNDYPKTNYKLLTDS